MPERCDSTSRVAPCPRSRIRLHRKPLAAHLDNRVSRLLEETVRVTAVGLRRVSCPLSVTTPRQGADLAVGRGAWVPLRSFHPQGQSYDDGGLVATAALSVPPAA